MSLRSQRQPPPPRHRKAPYASLVPPPLKVLRLTVDNASQASLFASCKQQAGKKNLEPAKKTEKDLFARSIRSEFRTHNSSFVTASQTMCSHTGLWGGVKRRHSESLESILSNNKANAAFHACGLAGPYRAAGVRPMESSASSCICLSSLL